MQIQLGHFWQGKSVVNMDTVLGITDITVKGAVSKRDLCSFAKLCVSNKENVIFITHF
jgi:hypothetical protein